jgi:hypothetical protein
MFGSIDGDFMMCVNTNKVVPGLGKCVAEKKYPGQKESPTNTSENTRLAEGCTVVFEE